MIFEMCDERAFERYQFYAFLEIFDEPPPECNRRRRPKTLFRPSGSSLRVCVSNAAFWRPWPLLSRVRYLACVFCDLIFEFSLWALARVRFLTHALCEFNCWYIIGPAWRVFEPRRMHFPEFHFWIFIIPACVGSILAYAYSELHSNVVFHIISILFHFIHSTSKNHKI